MKRKNKTKFSILGVISLKPMSGYELKRFMDKSIGNFWQESYGQIYPTLKQLLEEGLLKSKTKFQEKGVEKIIYSITKSGISELNSWLKEEVEIPSYRNELLLKLFFGRKISIEENLTHLKKYKLNTKKNLIKYEEILKSSEINFAKSKNLPYWTFSVKYGIKILNAELKWIEDTEESLKNLKK